MPTSFTKGDIFETAGLRAYAFGGCLDGSMDTGIASAIKKRWPDCATAYAAHCEGSKFAYGDVFEWRAGDVTIFALGIQQQPGEKPRLAALNDALLKLLELATTAEIERIGMVRIGTGAESLDWTRVRKMLGEIGASHAITLVVFEQFVRARPAT
jgi:O-acetyl-ADP-ribose deacetylase (regulator of RNase III)